ncbi:PAS domain-containing protein [Roseobacteraceae bacterium S113]
MSIELHQRAFQPQQDEDVLEVLGFAAPAVLLSMLRMTQEAVLLLDEGGSIIYANDNALLSLCETDLETVRGAHWTGHFASVDGSALGRAIAHAQMGLEVSFAYDVPRSGGTVCEVTLSPVFLRDGVLECICVVVRDQTANTNAVPSESG